MQAIDELLDRLTHLPPAPQMLPRLLKLLSQPDSEITEVVQLLRFDPAITAQLLRLCNSAFVAPGRVIESVEETVVLLGFGQVYRLVAGLCTEGLLSPPQQGYGIGHRELWQHSVVAAMAASTVANRAGADPNPVFTAALLHDLGKIALSEALASRYAQLLAEVENRQRALLEAERELLGVQHAEVGGRLLQRWGFSDQLVAAVWHHHQPKDAGPHEAITAQVYLGNMVAYFLGYGYGYQAFALRGQAGALELLGLGREHLPPLIIEVWERLRAEERWLHFNS